MQLHTIWDVYNHLKKERNINRTILEVAERDGSISSDVITQLEVATDFLTETLAAIDHGQGLPAEDEQ